MIVLDTTVLVYAVGGEHQFREPCRRLVAAADARAIVARTTVEVLQEFVHVRSQRRDRADAVARGRSYLNLFGPLLVSDEANLVDALAIFQSNPTVGMFDALLASVAIATGAPLVSADRGFGSIPGLEHLRPTDETVSALGA